MSKPSELEKVQRYDVGSPVLGGGMESDDQGDYIWRDDALAAAAKDIAEARALALDSVLFKIDRLWATAPSADSRRWLGFAISDVRNLLDEARAGKGWVKAP